MKKYTFWLTLSLIFSLSCNKEANPPDEGLHTYSEAIGASGGIISMDNLILLEVPAGALGEELTLTATPTLNENDYYKLNDQYVSGYLGGVSFEPNGTVFESPVKITLPIRKYLPPGSWYPLYYFDEDSNAWIESSVLGKVNSDGLSVTAEVTHFTPWGLFDLPSELFMLEKFKDYFGIGDDPIGAINHYIEWFNSTIQPFNFRGLVKNCCYAIRGYEIDIIYKVNGIENSLNRFVGESMPASYPQFWFVYDDSNESNANNIYLTISLKLYLGCKPDLSLSAEKSKLLLGEKTNITACLSCGDQKMSDAFLTIISSPEGSLDKKDITTNSSGESIVTLTAKEEGIAMLNASYEACKCEIETEEYIATLNLPIGESETWTGKLDFSVSGCDFGVCVSGFTGFVDFELIAKRSSIGENQSTFAVLNKSVSLGTIDLTEAYDGYVIPGSKSVNLHGEIKYIDGQFVLEWYLFAEIPFEFCYYPMPGYALTCSDDYSCRTQMTNKVETALPVDSDHHAETGEITFICFQAIDSPLSYTLTLHRQ